MSDNHNVSNPKLSVNHDNVFIDTSNPMPGYTYIPRFLFRMRLDSDVLGAIMYSLSYHQEWLKHLDGLIEYFEERKGEYGDISKDMSDVYLKDLETKYERFIGGEK